MDEICTRRLRLRQWTEADRLPFAAMHADPAVMEFMPSVLDGEQCDALVARNVQHFREHRCGVA